MNEVQLAITSQGKPRLLIRAYHDYGREYIYAECNQGCDQAGNWTLGTINITESTDMWNLYDDEQPQRSFALDRLDRPRFVQIDRNYFHAEPDRYGTFYMVCDADCTVSGNWHEVHIGPWDGGGQYEMFEYPALVFTQEGQPRIATGLSALGEEDPALYYFACDQVCEDVANWGRAKLWARGQGRNPGWDIALDAQDRPRIAFYPEALDDGSGKQLYYAWCDTNCLQPGNWQRLNLGLDVDHGGDPDMVFDKAGNPWIAFIAGDGRGVGVAACEANCQQAESWTDALMDSYQNLEAEWDVPFAPTCTGGLWNAWTPSLAFDAKGSLRLVYDATYHAKCWWSTDYQKWEEYYQFWLIQRSARGILVTMP